MNRTKSTMNPNLSGGDGVSRTGRSGWVSRAGGLRAHEDEARMEAASMSTGTLEMRVFFFLMSFLQYISMAFFLFLLCWNLQFAAENRALLKSELGVTSQRKRHSRDKITRATLSFHLIFNTVNII
jgi:hypothetical protein